MQILYTDWFKKRFSRLPLKVQKQFQKRIGLFNQNPKDPVLKAHPLKGNLVGLRAFSVTGDYRVIYAILGQDCIKLLDIGTHNQVY